MSSLFHFIQYFFRSTPDPTTFVKWSPLHIFFLLLAAVFAGSLFLLRHKIKKSLSAPTLGKIIAILLLIQQLSLYGWYIFAGTFRWYVSLPLYNCRFAALCLVVALLTRNSYAKIIGCYWGLPGALGALLLPDLDPYLFPHFTAISFFGGHIFILLGALYLLIIDDFTADMSSLIKMLIFTNIYHTIVYPIDQITGGNYCYLMAPPFKLDFFYTLMDKGLYTIFVFFVFSIAMVITHFLLKLVSKVAHS